MDKHRDKKVVQYVVFTGSNPPIHVSQTLVSDTLTYKLNIVHLPKLSVDKFSAMRDALAYAWCAATIKKEAELDIFTRKFVTLIDRLDGEAMKIALAVVKAY
jgi:hypothetical protein